MYPYEISTLQLALEFGQKKGASMVDALSTNHRPPRSLTAPPLNRPSRFPSHCLYRVALKPPQNRLIRGCQSNAETNGRRPPLTS